MCLCFVLTTKCNIRRREGGGWQHWTLAAIRSSSFGERRLWLFMYIIYATVRKNRIWYMNKYKTEFRGKMVLSEQNRPPKGSCSPNPHAVLWGMQVAVPTTGPLPREWGTIQPQVSRQPCSSSPSCLWELGRDTAPAPSGIPHRDHPVKWL